MEQGYFITGTGTNVGKTWATVALMRYFRNQGKSVIGMKPVASGCISQGGVLVNEDALRLQANASVNLEYSTINPYAYALPVSPHIAGKDNPVKLDVVRHSFNAIKDQVQIVLVEGAGGWFSPINESQDNSDLAAAISLPILLVVAIQLGGINQARLTFKAIIGGGFDCAGWIAVCSKPNELFVDENIAYIKKSLAAPLIGVLPYQDSEDFDELAKCFLSNL